MRPEAASLADALTRLTDIIARSDQAAMAGPLRVQVGRLQDEPSKTAREVMDQILLEEAPRVLTHGGVAYKEPGPAREEAFEYARLLSETYQAALALWHATRERPWMTPVRRPTKLCDYGWGHEAWVMPDGRFLARYDCGAHVNLWREDEIGADEAAQAQLGSRHFSRMVIMLQNRLSAAGIDPYKGSATPLEEPT